MQVAILAQTLQAHELILAHLVKDLPDQTDCPVLGTAGISACKLVAKNYLDATRVCQIVRELVLERLHYSSHFVGDVHLAGLLLFLITFFQLNLLLTFSEEIRYSLFDEHVDVSIRLHHQIYLSLLLAFYFWRRTHTLEAGFGEEVVKV